MSLAIKQKSIASFPLLYKGEPAQFVFKTMGQVSASASQVKHVPHRHNYYTIIWVTRGKGMHQLDFKQYPANPGTVFFISPEQVHDLRMDGPHDGYVLLFTEDFLERYGIGSQWLKNTGFFFRCDDVAPLTVTDTSKHELEQYARLIQDEFASQKPGYLDAIAALVKLFLLQCGRVAQVLLPQQSPKNHAGTNLVRQFKALLDEHYAAWHKVSEYAVELHITPNHLNEVVTAETGSGAKEMILSRITLEAKRFATHSELSLKEVAYQLGFEDPAHFSKLFKQQENIGFTDFRASIREKYS